ncbi:MULTISPECIES: PqqD family protein [Paenibacillus]|uniref:PqqD family protein n=1 Tax=Paenibacillus TaxID=44249 RepID=UPI000426735D|nr:MULTISPECIES: PqqD family protein [Paenibacillus]UMY54741.1 PqqD family protein [Paenibacillus peoriae]
MSIIKNKNLIIYEEEGDILLIDMINNKFYALDYISSLFWKKITNNIDKKDIIESICTQFEVKPEEVESDLNTFLLRLRELGVM